MSKLYTVSASPHQLGPLTLKQMHLHIMLAAAPALAMGVVYYGARSLLLVALSMAAAAAAEFICARMGDMPNRLGDLHAAMIGMLVGLVLPAGAPWWVALVGGALAVSLGKMLFGGLGAYAFNPVLVAWAALSISWPEHMNSFLSPADLAQAPSPLMAFKGNVGVMFDTNWSTMWSGAYPGAIGETCSWALVAGGLYLIWRRLIPWQIPVGTIIGAVVMTIVALLFDPKVAQLEIHSYGQAFQAVMFQLGAGGLMITAFFLATESVSSPMTPKGLWMAGLFVGAFTVIVRFWGAMTEGAFYGVLLMNTLTPIMDRFRPRVLGKPVEE